MGARVVAGAAASALAFALFVRVERPWLVLGWLGLVPWLAALDRSPSLRAALAGGLVFSVAFVIAVFGWFAPAIRSYTGASWPVAVGVLVLGAPLLQPQLVVFAGGRHMARRLLPGFWMPTLVAATLYVGVEWASGKLFADTIGHGFQASVWMRQAADLGGAAGLTLVLLVANECLGSAVAGRWRRALVPVALALALCGYGAVRCRQLVQGRIAAAPVVVGIVQPGIGDYERLRAELGTYDAVRMILTTHFRQSEDLLRRGGVDLLTWPENAYPTTFGSPKSEEGALFDRQIGGFVARAGVPLAFGAYDAEDGAEFSAAVFLEPTAERSLAFATYRKRRLFPFAERVPAGLDWPVLRRLLPWLGTWQPGRGPDVVPVALPGGRTVQVAPLICYDAVDPRLAIDAVRHGAEMLLTLSNDAWFATGLGPRLHLVVSAFRSIETRRPQVRVTTTGISAVIDATGELRWTADVHERATFLAAVHPERSATTLMLAWGDWLGPAALAAGVAGLAAGWLRSRRRGNSKV